MVLMLLFTLKLDCRVFQTTAEEQFKDFLFDFFTLGEISLLGELSL